MTDMLIEVEPKEKVKAEKPKMSAEQATTFERESVHNSEILVSAAKTKGCGCQPYLDWFTYDRWLAQGMQVQRREKGTKLVVKSESEDKEGKKRERFHSTYVFCRCQVRPTGSQDVNISKQSFASVEA